MGPSPDKRSKLHAEVLNHTTLGQFYKTKQLFRDCYLVLKLLGRGGFGVTFLAQNDRLPGRPQCVIKQLCPKVKDPAALDKARQRFMQEAKTLSRLGSHSQIPQLLEYFELDGEFFLIQEYVPGLTLGQEVRELGIFSETKVKQFLREILPLLQYVHDRRVIHRDIKPANMIRCNLDGRLVLIDFGAVKEQLIMATEHSALRTSISTQFVGTVGFAPPEQLSLRPMYASDIYALGVTCLYLLSGKSPPEFNYDYLTGIFKWRETLQLSDYFGEILDKMLRVSPRDRYQSPQEVLRALDLESHLESLLPCMSQSPLASPGVTEPVASYQKPYVSPAVQTAMAIRQWQERLQAKRDKQKLLQAGFTLLPSAKANSSSSEGQTE
jgi:serine/threonine protein kinase